MEEAKWRDTFNVWITLSGSAILYVLYFIVFVVWLEKKRWKQWISSKR